MRSSYVGFRRTSPGGGDLISWTATVRTRSRSVIGQVSEIWPARFAQRSKARWTSGPAANP